MCFSAYVASFRRFSAGLTPAGVQRSFLFEEVMLKFKMRKPLSVSYMENIAISIRTVKK